MAVYISHNLEFVLAALKIIGVVGAFAGFSSEAGRKDSRKSKAAFVFLSIAILSEVFDSAVKYKDGQEQAARFARLTHPLGQISITLFYHLNLDSPELERYAKNLQERGDILPDPEQDKSLSQLLLMAPLTDIFIYKGKYGPSAEPNLSFEVHFPMISGPGTHLRRDVAEREVFEARTYSYVSPVDSPEFIHQPSKNGYISAQITDRNHPEDRFSDGEIISDRDILGSTIAVRFCPIGDSANQVVLDSAMIGFPGNQELDLSPLGQRRAVVEKSKDDCQILRVTVPTTQAEYRKILRP